MLSAFQGRSCPDQPPRAAFQFCSAATPSPNTASFWPLILSSHASEPACTSHPIPSQPWSTECSREVGLHPMAIYCSSIGGYRHPPPRPLQTLLLLAASPFWHWGAWHAPPQDAHTFQRLSPLESQWLENPSYFSIFIFFWLPSFFWPLHKSSTASLSTSSKLHFLTSLLQQERSLLLAPLHQGAPTKAPCKNSLSPLMDDMEPAPGLCQRTAWPPGNTMSPMIQGQPNDHIAGGESHPGLRKG